MGPNRGLLELWGGIECTVNRVGDQYFDQLEYSGHAQRHDDLDLIAQLGPKVLRYPVLWERTEQPDGELDFTWADRRLNRIRELGMAPIIGLVHHGSGPRHTSLVDDEFPTKLATYAERVAQRYPWVERYTPVNEPLTTARFSGLYGHWYPHGRDDRTFVRALLTQCKAIALSMAAIRRVNPHAALVQTEDMGFTRSTDMLSYQARFDNERRWLSLDLLSGRVAAQHPLRAYLERFGATHDELTFFQDNPCPPNLLGVNYYVTSERFLDSRVSLYPAHLVGGNGRHAYADVEAVRVCAEGLVGPATILKQVYARYGLPMAITEAHLGGPVHEQACWLNWMWDSAHAARKAGVDLRAVTVWALLGAFGWDRLVTEAPRSYEPGAFHLAEGRPVATDLSRLVARLARGEVAGASAQGWWTCQERLLYEPHIANSKAA
jgi:dTDP-4-dehydrorhamnose reductase